VAAADRPALRLRRLGRPAGLARRAEIAAAGVIEGVDSSFLRRYLLEDIRYRLPADQVGDALAEFGRRAGALVRG